IEIRLRTIALGVMFDAEPCDFCIDGQCDFFLSPLDLGTPLLRCANDVEGSPGQHTGNRVEIGSKGIATNPRSLKGDRSAPTECVGHLRPVAESGDPKLLDKVGEVTRRRAQMVVHIVPDTYQ